MTLAQVKGYARALSRLERERLLHAAVSARAAQADEKGWKQWVKEVSA